MGITWQPQSGATAMIPQVALRAKNALRKLNRTLSKRRRAKKMRIQSDGSLTIQNIQELLGQEGLSSEKVQESQPANSGRGRDVTKVQRCGVCGKPGHNACIG